MKKVLLGLGGLLVALVFLIGLRERWFFHRSIFVTQDGEPVENALVSFQLTTGGILDQESRYVYDTTDGGGKAGFTGRARKMSVTVDFDSKMYFAFDGPVTWLNGPPRKIELNELQVRNVLNSDDWWPSDYPDSANGWFEGQKKTKNELVVFLNASDERKLWCVPYEIFSYKRNAPFVRFVSGIGKIRIFLPIDDEYRVSILPTKTRWPGRDLCHEDVVGGPFNYRDIIIDHVNVESNLEIKVILEPL